MLPEQCNSRPVENMVILARLTGALQLRFVFRLHQKYPLHRSTRAFPVQNEIKATFMTFTWLGQCIDSYTARKWSMKMSLAFLLSSSSFALIPALLSGCLPHENTGVPAQISYTYATVHWHWRMSVENNWSRPGKAAWWATKFPTEHYRVGQIIQLYQHIMWNETYSGWKLVLRWQTKTNCAAAMAYGKWCVCVIASSKTY